jgi:hypothetical protein
VTEIKKLRVASEMVRRFWVKSCTSQGIDPDSKFVVPDFNNPYVRAYNRAMGLYQRQYRRVTGMPVTPWTLG